MTMVPALAEMHAAHIERQKRMGAIRLNLVPLEIVRPQPAPPEPVNDDVADCEEIPRFLPPRRTDWTRLVSEAILRPCDARVILKHVSYRTGTKIIDLQSERRTAKIVIPRWIACWVMREYTMMSLPQIGRHLGGRDHTTVLHSIRRIEQLRESDPGIRKLSDEIASAACKEMQG